MGSRVMAFVLVAGCFNPEPPKAPCSELDECPVGLACRFGLCGGDESDAARIGFATAASLVDEASGTIVLPVVLSTAALVPITVNVAVSGGTATRDVDFTTTADVELSFVPGETEKSIEVTIINDTEEETDETIELALTSATGGVLGVAGHTMTIGANLLPRINFTAPALSAAENAPQLIELVLDAPSAFPISVDYMIAGTASGSGVDYTLAAGTLTFDAGVTSHQVAVGVIDDALDEDDETVVLTLSNPINSMLGTVDVHTYTILDQDPTPTVSFSSASSSINEASSPASLTLTLSAPSGRTVTVPFASSVTSTATVTADYSYTTVSPLSFSPGTTSRTIAVSIVQDTIGEVDETLITTLGLPTNATLGTTPTHTLTIVDDDRVCYGAGIFAVCLASAPTTPVVLPASINTDTSPLCQANQPLGWIGAGQPPSCVIAGTMIAMGGVVATGSRPLVLVAADAITISATLDVASHRTQTTGPGAPSASCSGFPTLPVNDNGGAGGAAGGTFMSRGGNGGAGSGGGAAAGSSPAVGAAPTVLRAGCDGQLGGKAASNLAGAIGRGGGAVYLVAGNTITISSTGVINASGSAASAGASMAGGSGAGSGGMIVLYAPAIAATGGTLLANGGGGAAGGGATASGVAGTDPSPSTPLAQAAGGSSVAGDGGSGFAASLAAGGGSIDSVGGGGGGGGGGFVMSNMALVGATISAGLILP